MLLSRGIGGIFCSIYICQAIKTKYLLVLQLCNRNYRTATFRICVFTIHIYGINIIGSMDARMCARVCSPLICMHRMLCVYSIHDGFICVSAAVRASVCVYSTSLCTFQFHTFAVCYANLPLIKKFGWRWKIGNSYIILSIIQYIFIYLQTQAMNMSGLLVCFECFFNAPTRRNKCNSNKCENDRETQLYGY